MGADLSEAEASAVLERLAAASAAQAGSENFPVALRVLPKDPRDKLMRAYAFARFVDDVGDEAPGDRLALLDVIDADVRALPSGTAVLPVVQALRPLVEDSGTPLSPFLDLIEANRIDQRVSSYSSLADLLHYCDYSAAPVGRIVLHIAEAATEQNVADSDAVCNALQVLEHCQDVGEDARAGRVYIPGVQLDDALASATGPTVRVAVATHVALARGMLHPGRALVRRLHGWPRLAIAGFVGGGLATAVALRRAEYDVLARTVRPSKGRTAREAARLWVGRA
ncbi:MAG TPA: squalene/phytoene synthase family protein [Jatrophihabitantaceae bacterium]|nr:squalene/phytoene synthase family protein [Jatrophihabitantaceae bacterium]